MRANRRGVLGMLGLGAVAPGMVGSGEGGSHTVRFAGLGRRWSGAGMVGQAKADVAHSAAGFNRVGSYPDVRIDLGDLGKAIATASKQREIQDRVRQVMGGLPPHLASMHSCAPWFRATAAVRWEMAREAKQAEMSRTLQERMTKGLQDAVGEAVGGIGRIMEEGVSKPSK